MRHLLIAVVFVAFAAVPGAPAAGQAPDLRKMNDLAQFTLEKLEIAPAQWSVTHQYRGKLRGADVAKDGDMIRYNLFTLEGENKTTAIQIIARDGFWYVQEGTERSKFLPWQAVFDDAGWYDTLSRVMPDGVPDPLNPPGEFIDSRGGVAVYRAPIPYEAQQRIQRQIARMEAIKEVDEERAREQGLGRKAQDLRQLLTEGVPVRLDTSTGLLLDYGPGEDRNQLMAFAFVAGFDERMFKVSDRNWTDRTGELAVGDLGDLAMFSYLPKAPTDTEAAAAMQPMLVVAHMRTRRFRRVPVPFTNTSGICFLGDRSKVAIVVMDMATRSALPYQVDLETGKHQRLGDNLLTGGLITSAEPSPDGTKIALTHKQTNLSTFSQVYVIDVDTRKAKAIGEPITVEHISWLPDNDGFVYMEPRYSNDGRIRGVKLKKLDLEGRSSDLLEGALYPVVLPKLRKIFFFGRGESSGEWRTCDLFGQNVVTVGDGLANYRDPVPGPDGKSVMMMHYPEGQLPRPVIVDVTTGEPKPVDLGAGVWGTPVWR